MVTYRRVDDALLQAHDGLVDELGGQAPLNSLGVVPWQRTENRNYFLVARNEGMEWPVDSLDLRWRRDQVLLDDFGESRVDGSVAALDTFLVNVHALSGLAALN